MSEANALIAAVKAETLLKDSYLLTQIEELRKSLQYKTDGSVFSYDDYYFTLQKQIEDMSRIKLQSEIAPHTESQYQIQLSQALEAVYDDSERITSRLLHFLSKLKTAQERMETLKASFVAWYALAVGQFLKSYDVDLGKTVVADLARAEFERLIGGVDVEVSSLIEAVKVQVATVTKRKQIAQDKFNLGKDQANASWTSSLIPTGGINSDPNELLADPDEEEEEETTPEYVSRQPQVASTEEVQEIRGVFAKFGDAKPATPVTDERI